MEANFAVSAHPSVENAWTKAKGLYHGGMQGNENERFLGCNKNLPLSLSFLSGSYKLEGLCGCSFGI